MHRKNGFTIIEVVLVLAVAGLIFAMVFVALPALQAQQRDEQRRRNVSEIIAAMELYKKNNGGLYPGTMATGRRGQPCFNMTGSGCSVLDSWNNNFLPRYAGEYEDPLVGKPYYVTASSNYGAGCKEVATHLESAANNSNHSYLGVCYSTNCDDDYSNARDSGTIAILYKAERGGIVCMNNK